MSLRLYKTSVTELTDVRDDSIRHSSGPVVKSYIVLAALRRVFLACSVASSLLGKVGRACGSKASLSWPLLLLAMKALMVLAD